MAYLLPDASDEPNDYTVDYWTLNTGPFGVSGFCMDGSEVGNYCYMCVSDLTNVSRARLHFECKKHAQKVKALRAPKTKFIIEPSTGGDMNDPDNLFLPDRCKVCDADLSTSEQQEMHYMSEKHQKKVRNYFLVKVGIREKKPEVEVDEEELKKKSELEYCPLCKVELSAPVVAEAHYAGKKHAKKLREKIDNGSDQTQPTSDVCEVAKIEDADAAEEDNRRSVRKRKEEIEVMLKEEAAKRACLTQELEEIKKLEESQSDC